MIYVERTKIRPSVFGMPYFTKIKEKLEGFYKISQDKRRQQKPPYIPMGERVMLGLANYLLHEFSGKCAYCESRALLQKQFNFDHFRPKSSAKGQDNEFSLDHYWTLAYDYKNMYLCCSDCNKAKQNWFPVMGLRADLKLKYEQIIRTETPLLLDPCNDDPETHFIYDESGIINSTTPRGLVTIEYAALNRITLVKQRQEIVIKTRKQYEDALVLFRQKNNTATGRKAFSVTLAILLGTISKLMEPKVSLEFAGMRRFLLRKWINQDTQFKGQLLSRDSDHMIARFLKIIVPARAIPSNQIHKAEISGKAKIISQRLKIDSIEVKNFKGIEDLTIQYPKTEDTKRQNWLMLLGENGVGKSSLLQAIAITLMGKKYFAKLGIKPVDIYKTNSDGEGLVKINQDGGEPIELSFTDKTITHPTSSMNAYLLGYGSTRLFSTKKIKADAASGKVRVKNLFEPDIALYAEDWLLSLYKKNMSQFDFACRALKDLLSREFDDDKIEFRVENKNIWIHYSKKDKKPAKLKQLSDGYKSIIALACDMMYPLLKDNSTIESAEGIVLIDEIGTHLHPRWKMRVVNSFRSAFPKMQFIVTTHDPLCLKGLKGGEVVVMEKDKDEKIIVKENLPDPGEFSAEQLLSSSFFGLLSTIDEDLERDFAEYYELLGIGDKTSDKQKKRIEELKLKLKDKRHMGQTLREELALTAADQLLAEEKSAETNTGLVELHSKTKELLKNLWEDKIAT